MIQYIGASNSLLLLGTLHRQTPQSS